MTKLPQNPDVVVVGAGTAGLSAASALREAGFETLVLEADDHVGGRCITDTTTFSTPFDRGGSWLHSAEINPLSSIAEQHGLSLHKEPWISKRVVINGKTLSNDEVAGYVNYSDLMWDRIKEVGTQDQNTAIAPILPDGDWKDTAKLFISHIIGGDYDVASAADLANYDETDGNWLVGGGLGNFIKHLHSDVSVELNCPVSKIDYSGNKIRVTTPKGIVQTHRVVITVSVGILAAEKIEFVPPLPNDKLQAVNDLPNGLLNKVGIEFKPEWKEVYEGYMLDYHTTGEDYCNILFGFYDTPFATSFFGGRFAAQLENEGPGSSTDFCMEALREAFGSDILKYINKTSEASWHNNPHTLGAYSYATPGRAAARKTLAEPLNEQLYFAGEATMPNHFATVHGAYMSGKRAAAEVINEKD